DVKALTIVVDKNPAPIAAVFTFGAGAGLGERVISTRVRVDMYTNIRAILETVDGKLHMVTKYVKAAGGCSAPALKDADEALAALGKMQIRSFNTAGQSAGQSKPLREAQVMIKHPNYSGMQMNQLTGLYIPAKYVQHMEVRRDSELVFKLEGGISLSEDPNIRFTYADGGTGVLEVTARDTDGSEFKARATPSGS
ncbi:MAG: quinoprotein dehydrogenase-associated SoxYZ-like carrier, partial [Hyphomicrobium sp.]